MRGSERGVVRALLAAGHSQGAFFATCKNVMCTAISGNDGNQGEIALSNQGGFCAPVAAPHIDLSAQSTPSADLGRRDL